MKLSRRAALFATLTLAGTAAAQTPVIHVLPGVGGAFGFQNFPTTVSDDGTAMVGYGSGCWHWGLNDIPQLSLYSSSAGWISGDSTCTRVTLEQYIDWNTRQRYCVTWQDGFNPANVCTPVAGWTGCDDDVVNVACISGNGNKVAGLIWETCRTSPGVYDIPTATWTVLPKTLPTISAKINQLNRDGNVVAGWNDNVARRGCVWINGAQTLLSIGASNCSEAYGVSSNGRWVIGKTNSPVRNVWRWQNGTAPDAAEDLGTIPTSINSGPVVLPTDVSDNGKVVIGARGSTGFNTAFIWRQGIGYESMDSFLASKGVVMSNYIAFFDRISLAMDMSPDGRYMALQGADLGGTYYPILVDLGPQACSDADMGSQGGVATPDYRLDNNDFVVFIDKFFSGDTQADMGVQGGIPGHDGNFDNNDFIVFIDVFFAGC